MNFFLFQWMYVPYTIGSILTVTACQKETYIEAKRKRFLHRGFCE